MGLSSSLPFFFQLLLLLLLLTSKYNALELGIGIGIGVGTGSGGPGSGGGSETPSTPPEPQRCDFINQKQYEAYLVIQRFKRTITCDPNGVTSTWVGPRPCNYTGFRCDTPPNAPGVPTIAAIDFNGFSLASPTLCGFVDQLPDLAFFHMNSNNFAGNLPDLTKLPFLYEVDVSNNKMTGSFPAVAGIKPLLFLDVRFNAFSGTVPASVFNVKLAVLFINNNKFDSALPANLGSTTAKYITLANNGFTGAIPRSIGDAAENLTEILFLNNRLSGCLPDEVGLLRKATVFDVGNNLLSGEIPPSFGCLGKVEQLNLAGNQLSGEVPDVVCKLENLKNLSLSGNYFTSFGKSCQCLMRQRRLDVRRNCIPGIAGQRSPEECYKFACKPKQCNQPKGRNCFTPCKLEAEKLPLRSDSGGAPAVPRAYFALVRRQP